MLVTAYDPGSEELSRGGELVWRERKDGTWIADFPIGSGHYELKPMRGGFHMYRHESGSRPVDLGHHQTLGGAMGAAKRDVDRSEPAAAEGKGARDCGCPHAHPPEVPTHACEVERKSRGKAQESHQKYRILRGKHAGQIGTLYALRGQVYGGSYGFPLKIKGRIHTIPSADVEPVVEDEHTAKDAAPYDRNTRDPGVVEAGRELGVMNGGEDVYRALHSRLSHESQEVFLVIPLDLRGQPLCPPVEVARGQRDQVEIDPSDVYRPVIEHNAKGFLVVHCHPSGHAKPSPADKALTASLRKGAPVAFGQKGGRFVDHVIIASSATRGEFYSFREGKRVRVRHR